MSVFKLIESAIFAVCFGFLPALVIVRFEGEFMWLAGLGAAVLLLVGLCICGLLLEIRSLERWRRQSLPIRSTRS